MKVQGRGFQTMKVQGEGSSNYESAQEVKFKL